MAAPSDRKAARDIRVSKPIPCELVTWSRFHALARRLARQVRDSGYRPDIIVAIGRGGYMPARILSDLLGLMDLATFKIEHYTGPRISKAPVIRYPLTADVSGKRVLLVDDVSDSGDTFNVAIDHVRSRGEPVELRTAVLHHKTVSRYRPDYFATRVAKWRWIIYPWAVAEDISSIIRAMRPRPTDIADIAQRLKSDHGIRPSPAILADVTALLSSG